jgi:2'-5' RNA ligase
MSLLLTEASKGCMLLVLDLPTTVQIQEWIKENIPEDQLAADGVEHESHVTVLYGFKPEVRPENVVDTATGFGNIPIRLGKISRFENDEFDVLKVEVEGDRLHEFNAFLVQMFEDELEQTYPDYHPHLTLAYVRKGACRELDGNSKFDGKVYVFDTAVFSTPESERRLFVVLDDDENS